MCVVTFEKREITLPTGEKIEILLPVEKISRREAPCDEITPIRREKSK